MFNYWARVCLLLVGTFIFSAPGAYAIEPILNSEVTQALGVLAKSRAGWDELAERSSITSGGVDYNREITEAESRLVRSGFYLKATPEWLGTNGRLFLDNPVLLSAASLSDIRMLLGGLSRQERFVAGAMGKAILTGVYSQAYQRVLVLMNAR